MDKSEAKKKYKRAKRPMGVYRIRNAQNGKSYVGYSIDLQARINRQETELKFGSHRNSELLGEWKSFGEPSFEFEVLDELELGEKRNTLEQFSHRKLGLDLKMGLLLNLGIDPAFLSMTELYNYISFLHDNEQRSPEYEVVFWSKMVVPVLSVLLLLLSLPFVIKDVRNADMGKHLMAGSITGVLFFLVSKTSGFAGVVYDVSPLLVAWIPVLLIAGATAWLYRRLV